MIPRLGRIALRVLLPVLISLPAGAESAPVARPLVVEIEVVGSDEAVSRLRATANVVLGRLGITPVVGPEKTQPGHAPSAGALAQVYVDLAELRSPRLVVVESATQRELARRKLETSGSLETSIESVTLVLYMVIEALLSQATPSEPARSDGAVATAATGTGPPPAASEARARAARPERPSAAQDRAPEPADSEPARAASPSDAEIQAETASYREPGTPDGVSAFRYGAGAFLRLATLDNSRALPGAGASLDLSSERSKPHTGASLFAAVHAPTEVGSGETRAELTTFSARLVPMLEFPWTSAAAARIGVGGGVDWFRAEARSVRVGESHSVSMLDAVLCALLGVRVTLAGPLVASAAATLDLDLDPYALVIESGGKHRTLFEIERFRPSLMLGLAFSPALAAKGSE